MNRRESRISTQRGMAFDLKGEQMKGIEMSRKRREGVVRLACAMGVALLFALGPAPQAEAVEKTSLVETMSSDRALNESVIDTYWSFKCPNNVSGHNIARFNITYKTITFNKTFSLSHREKIGSSLHWSCSCKTAGIATHWKNHWVLH